MTAPRDRDDIRGAMVALARSVGLDAPGLADRLERGDPRQLLADALGAQSSLLPEDPQPLIAAAQEQIANWQHRSLEFVTVRDEAYPAALHMVHDRPALLWVAGDTGLLARERSIAVVGTRQPSSEAQAQARSFAADLVRSGFTVLSGLAAGIDAIAHRAAIQAGGRTIAVIGTGLDHSYPPVNAALHAQIARDHAVVSPFWPDDGPAPERFRRRNAVMSGLGEGTVIIEASVRSGTRVQARHALAHGRPVFLRRPLLTQNWAAELAAKPGVHVVDTATDVIDILALAQGPITPDPPAGRR